MDFHQNTRLLLTENAIKRHSKRLQQYLEKLGHQYNTVQSQNIFANVLGMEDWNAVKSILNDNSEVTKEKNSKINKENIQLALDSNINQIMDFVNNNDFLSKNNVKKLLSMLNIIEDFLAIVIQSDTKFMLNTDGRFYTGRLLSDKEIEYIAKYVGGSQILEQMAKGYDGDYQVNETHRATVNITAIFIEKKSGICITIHKPTMKKPEPKDLLIHTNLLNEKHILYPKQGLVIISGATGSGKKLLLHSIIQERINQQKEKTVIYETPCQYEYILSSPDKHILYNGNIEIEKNFLAILKRKPDVLSFSNIHSMEDIDRLVTCALTGHATYGLLHASGVANTIRRIISTFLPLERKTKILDFLATNPIIISTKKMNKIFLYEYLHITPEISKKIIEQLELTNYEQIDFKNLLNPIIEKEGQSFLQSGLIKYKYNLLTQEDIMLLIRIK